MQIATTELEGVLILEPKVFEDHRGFFMETYNSEVFEKFGLPTSFVQDNHSLSKAPGTLRGLHYQLHPAAQGKLVRCIRGKIIDVAIDIRVHSKTFKKWISVELSAENKKQIWIPAGFAHGFVTLEPDTEIVYKVTHTYSAANDRSILWNDPDLDIAWNVANPVLSEKDLKAPLLKDADLFRE